MTEEQIITRRELQEKIGVHSGHVLRVKLLPCSVCDAGGGEAAPSEAHEIKQGQWFTAVALCPDCHRGSHNSIGRGIWRVKKMTELDALAVTIERLMAA